MFNRTFLIFSTDAFFSHASPSPSIRGGETFKLQTSGLVWEMYQLILYYFININLAGPEPVIISTVLFMRI